MNNKKIILSTIVVLFLLNMGIWLFINRNNYTDTPLVTTVEPEQSEIEVKDFLIEEVSDIVFSLKNTGKNPLVIQQIESSCGCTVPEWDKQPVTTGKSAKIQVRIIPKESGLFNKTITVHCNTKEGQILLKLKLKERLKTEMIKSYVLNKKINRCLTKN
jgi:hypothetical protein